MGKYKDFAGYMADKFPGIKVQKISVNAGFSCPNRDGTIGTGGCIYCDNTSFTPGYCFNSGDIRTQLEDGKRFFSKKYTDVQYLAYFQSFSNTFGKSVSDLRKMYEEALSVQGIVGLIIGTRPDTLPQEVVEMMRELNLNRPVIVELGAETSHDTTLQTINRGHTWNHVVDAVGRLSDAGISVGLHLIMGLPGENEEMQLETVRRAVELPIDSLKFHQLQVLKGTTLASKLESGELDVRQFTLDEYIRLCVKIVRIVPKHIAIERFVAVAPPEKLISPKWGIKNYEFTNLLNNKLRDE